MSSRPCQSIVSLFSLRVPPCRTIFPKLACDGAFEPPSTAPSHYISPSVPTWSAKRPEDRASRLRFCSLIFRSAFQVTASRLVASFSELTIPRNEVAMAYHGFYSKVGPLYRNLEEHRFRVKTPLNLDRLLEDAARLFGVNPPTQAQNKRRLVLGVQQVRDLGLQGSRLIVEVGEGRCVISYRTVHPRRSRPELQRL